MAKQVGPIAMRFALFLLLAWSLVSLTFEPELWALSSLQTGTYALMALVVIRDAVAAWRTPAPVSGASVKPALGERLYSLFPYLPLGLAAVWPVVQIWLGTTVYRWDTRSAALYWFGAFCAFHVARSIALESTQPRTTGSGESAELHRLLHLLLWLSFIICLVATVNRFTAPGKLLWIKQTQYAESVFGPFIYRNNFAAFVELTVPLAVYYAFRNRSRQLLCAAMGASMFAAVVASGSRAGAALLSALMALLLVLAPRKQKEAAGSHAGLYFKLAVFAAAAVLVVGYQYLAARYQFGGITDETRFHFWQSSLNMALARPWFGFGMGTWVVAYPEFALIDPGTIANHAHNEWLQWAAEGGFPFFGFMLAVFLWAIRPAVRSVWGLGILSVFLHAFVDYPFVRFGLGVWIFAFLGFLSAYAHPTSAIKDGEPVRS